MGEPAELDRTDITRVNRIADAIVEAVVDDTDAAILPLVVDHSAGVPFETVLLQMAQEIRRLRNLEPAFGDSDRQLAASVVQDLKQKLAAARQANEDVCERCQERCPHRRITSTGEDPVVPATAEVRHSPAAGEVLPPGQRASWARGKTPHDR